jgi:hypothetical protein
MIQKKLSNEDTGEELELNVIENWNEVTLGTYLKFIELIDVKSKLELSDEEFFIKELAIIAGVDEQTLMEYPLSELGKFLDVITNLIKLEVDETLPEYIEIDDKLYVPKKNMSNLTAGEMIVIKTLQEKQAETGVADVYLGMIAVLLRPGFKREENGVVKYLQHKLEIESLMERKNIFKNKLMADRGMILVKSFILGTTE